MNRFTGTWQLESYETVHGDGRIDYPFGREVEGLLVYTADGWMTGQVMKKDRGALPAGYRKLGPTAAILEAFDGYIAYCGRYRVDQERGEVVHEVKASLYPNWVGTEQRRTFSFDGERMVLGAELRRGGAIVVNRLIWKKIG